MSKNIFLLFAFVCVAATTMHSQSAVGTSAGQFLKIGIGARAVAMGGAYVALADEPSALYWNPAGIATFNRIQLYGSYTKWFADIQHQFVGVCIPLGSNNILGFSVNMLSSGDMEQTTLYQPEGNGVFFSSTDIAMGVTYGMHLTDRLSVGLTGKYILQSYFNESAATFAGDIGVLMNTGYQGISLGMNFSNLGGELQLDGSDLITKGTGRTGTNPVARLATESFSLPLNFRVGIAMEILGKSDNVLITDADNRLTLTIDGNHPNDNKETIAVGTEYVWNDLLALRGGYLANSDISSFSYGGGIKWSFGEALGINVDYAYADLGILGPVQRISLSLQF